MGLFRLLAFFAICLTAMGCQEFQALEGPPADLATEVEDGYYTGPLYLEARAYLGPIVVKQGACVTDIELKVRSYAKHYIRGDVSCDMEGLGQVTVDITGEMPTVPLVYGDVQADEYIDADWEGWFYGYDNLYGETVGETHEGALRIEYWGWFDTQRTGLIDWEHRPEHSDQLSGL